MAGQQTPTNGNQVDLEATDSYLSQAKAEVHRSKARTANVVATVLVLGLVLSLPLHVLAMASSSTEATVTHLDRAFQRWYDILAPLVGAVIGYLFGLSAFEKGHRERP
jgi:hypothetical protein